MEQIWLFILSLSGVLSLTLCNTHDYILIKELKTWGDAQAYCRKHHVDLATVQSDENFQSLQKEADKNLFSLSAWTGLYNDINGWRWSYEDENKTFDNWWSEQPNNYGAGQECVVLRSDGLWNDLSCSELRFFVCYDDQSNSTDTYVLVTKVKTWLEAQTHCRKRYTDLVTIRNQTDNDLLTEMIPVIADAVWIGLFRDKWKWSDQANFTSSTEVTVQHLIGPNEDCASVDYTGYIEDYICSKTLYFYCDTVKLKRQIVRLEVKADQKVSDATLKALVLQQIHSLSCTFGRWHDTQVRNSWIMTKSSHFPQKKSGTPMNVCISKNDLI
ncbi:macrophage mannose receptor 1-like isoform X2 [Myxocyprinus asiaticus]|uniref:macrophage mannose receptor 1-like isoform X2 n=1 Tax=Myxocyprinus asiaticus TaxID=70543 RepID=UPI002223351A|nr:macrophage mannose receptor 1-like isoform X2 [Myxocyprinus asiaticus]